MRIHWLTIATLVFTSSCGEGGSETRSDPNMGANSTPPPQTTPTDTPSPSTTPSPPPQGVGLTERPESLSHNFPIEKPSQTELALELMHEGLSRPIFFAQVPGSDIHLVVEQRGNIVWFNKNDSGAGGTFMRVPDPLTSANEEGLLGLAFDPDIESNGYFYLHYTQDIDSNVSCINELTRQRDSCSVVARFQLAQNSAGEFITTQGNPNSKQVILMQRQPFSNHNGGMITFGPDGFLYIGLGDGGSGGDPDGHSQNRENLLGNVLRIDVRNLPYSIPQDNPFSNNSQGIKEEIWAYGIRNPWRFSFDSETGQLWLADVGQNAWEEVDIIQGGGNYGWNFFEGNNAYQNANRAPEGIIPPVIEYSHARGSSITGGYVYRGNNLPAWKGWYFYGDFASGTVWAANVDTINDDNVDNREIMSTGFGISSFGVDADNELYILDFSGKVHRIVRDETNSQTQLPKTLSETGLFTDTTNLTPATGLIPYNVNAPFWSDGTSKSRWFAIPENDTINFSDEAHWELPVGSVTVKQFDMPLVDGNLSSTKRLETRVFFHHTEGWAGYTYRWNDSQTEAILINGTESTSLSITQSDNSVRNQKYVFPGRAICLTCHNDTAGEVLGIRTKQLNRNFNYTEVLANQLATFNFITLFNQDIGSIDQFSSFTNLHNSNASLAQRARDYLAVNCAVCHLENGPTATDIDLREFIALENSNTLNVLPTGVDLDIENGFIIAQGSKERSILWQRMRIDNEYRMPPQVSHRVDDLAVEVIGQWIDGL